MKYIGINGDKCCVFETQYPLKNNTDIINKMFNFKYETYNIEKIKDVLLREYSVTGKKFTNFGTIGILDNDEAIFIFSTIKELRKIGGAHLK